MLKKYFNYIKEAVSSISTPPIIKPDPKGYSKILNDRKSYKNEYLGRIKTAMEKVTKDVAETMIETIKEDITGRLIAVKNDQGYTKIIHVKEITITQSNNQYYPLIEENKDRKVRYVYDNDDKSRIFFMDTFLTFFEENYLNNVISFNGNSLKSGSDMKFTKHIVDIGIRHQLTSDQILVDDDKGNRYVFHWEQPIKLFDMRIKELDPYGEENWEN